MKELAPEGTLHFQPGTSGRRGLHWPMLLALLLPFFLALALVSFDTLGIAVCAGIFLAVVLFSRPILLLNLVVLFVAIEDLNLISDDSFFAITGVKVIGYLLAASLGVDILVRGTKLRPDAIAFVLGAYFLLLITSLSAAMNVAKGVSELLRFIQLVVLFYAVRHLVDCRERLRLVSVTLLVTMSVSALIGLYQYFASGEERISGASQNAAILAADLIVALALGIAVFRTELNLKMKVLWGFLLALVLVTVALSMTRAAIISLVLSVFLVSLISGTILRSILLIVGGLAVFFVAVPNAVSLVERTVQVRDNSTRQHLRTLKAGVQMVMDYPILGVGLGNYPDNYLRYTNDERETPRSAHNTYLAIASESGLPALGLYLLFVLLCLGHTIRVILIKKWEGDKTGTIWAIALCTALVALSIFGFFHTLRVSKFLWIVMALTASATLATAPKLIPDDTDDGHSVLDGSDDTGDGAGVCASGDPPQGQSGLEPHPAT